MLSNQPACWRTTEAGCETFGAITRNELDAEGTEDVDAPAGPRSTVLFPSGHGGGDGGIYQPMTSFNLTSVSYRKRIAGESLCNR